MKTLNTTCKTIVLSVALLSLGNASLKAQSVTLQQRWVKGQQLTYNVALNGALNLQAPPGASIPGANAAKPIKIGLDLSCLTTVDTVDVDEKGTGTLAMRTGNVAFRAAALGGQFVLRDGIGYTTLAGKSIAPPRDINLAHLQNPREAWLISKQGRFQGIVPLPAVAGAETNQTSPNGAPSADVAPSEGGAVPAISALLQNRIIQALPALWPQNDVKAGDTWAAEVKWPLGDKASTQAGTDADKSSPTNDDATTETSPGLGKFNLTFVGQEEVDGRMLQHITIDGTVEVDEGKAAALTTLAEPKPADGAATAQPAKAPPGRMLGTRQRVSGAMWLDAQAQQLSRLDLDLAAQTALLSNTVGNTGKPGTWWFDFAGKLRMQLNHVSGAATGAASTTKDADAKSAADAAPAAPKAP